MNGAEQSQIEQLQKRIAQLSAIYSVSTEIKEEYYDKIFQMFQTLSPRDKFESTGVGLTVVKKIVDLYGGRIWIESQIGQGSTFIFTIPKHKEQKERIKYEILQTNSVN